MNQEQLLEQKKLLSMLNRLEAIEMETAFCAEDASSKPTEQQLAILKDNTSLCIYVPAANRSGKTQLGARIACWHFTNSHPYFVRPKEWGKGGILMMIVGRTRELVEVEIWNKKMKPLLDSNCYKEVYNGVALQRVINKENGNIITFASHEGNKQARDKLQGYTAQWTWVDELPADAGVFTELQVRTMTMRGRFFATFTPLVRNEKIKNLVDGCDGVISKKYPLLMLDNPALAGREEEILKQMEKYPPAERRARLYGEWYYGDAAVYPFDADLHCGDLPKDYHRSWRHIEGVDPAAAGLFGFVLLVEDPRTSRWYVVRAQYLDGDAPSTLLDKVEKLTEGYHIVKRTCDPAESWFVKEAAKRGRYYLGANKHDRKKEMIETLRQALFDRLLVIPSYNTDLTKELSSCQYHPDIPDKIIHAKKYHCCDALQYILDIIPKPEVAMVYKTPYERLEEQDRLRRVARENTKRTGGKTKRHYGALGVGRRWKR